MVIGRRFRSGSPRTPRVAGAQTAGGHLRDDAGEAASLAGDRPAGHHARKTLAYARVSSHDQKPDRVRQASRLHYHGLSSGFQNIGVIQASEAA